MSGSSGPGARWGYNHSQRTLPKCEEGTRWPNLDQRLGCGRAKDTTGPRPATLVCSPMRAGEGRKSERESVRLAAAHPPCVAMPAWPFGLCYTSCSPRPDQLAIRRIGTTVSNVGSRQRDSRMLSHLTAVGRTATGCARLQAATSAARPVSQGAQWLCSGLWVAVGCRRSYIIRVGCNRGLAKLHTKQSRAIQLDG
jgi:hypothetical protein